jgi:hypothetical protein
MEHQRLQRMALMAPDSWDESTNSAQIVVSTDADVGDGFMLVHSQQAIRWPQRPLPADYDHLRTSESIWGAVTDLSLERASDGTTQLIGRVVVDGPPTAMDVALPRLRTGSARFSVDARIYGVSEQADGMLLATDWEPQLVSLVAAGQDSHAVMRAIDNSPEDSPMTVIEQAGGSPAEVETQAPESAPTPEPEASEVQRSASDDRLELIVRRAASEASLGEEIIQRILADNQGRTATDALTAVVRAQRQELERRAPVNTGAPAPIAVTRDEGDSLVRAYGAELERRAGLIVEPTEVGKRAFGLTALEMVRGYLESRGVNTMGMSKNAIVQRGFLSTSDFPNLFANVANKRLREAYAEEPQTWKPLATQRTIPDFKPVYDLQVAGQTVPELIQEGGEYKAGFLTEGKMTWNLATYGKQMRITRQSIINDDLNSLSRVPDILGRGCRLLESNLVWSLLTDGANGATVSLDGKALFDSSHANTISGASSVISIAGMDLAKTKLRKQLDLASNRLNLAPAYLVVPVELETTALQFLYPTGYSPIALTGNTGPNPFAMGVQLIVEPRLSDDSTSYWYLTSSPNRVDMIQYGYLAGEGGPTILTNLDRNPDYVELLVRMDFGCALSDHRGFVRSAGA